MRHIHTSIVSRHLSTRGNNKILRTPPPHIISSEEILPCITRRTLAQLRTNKSPFLKSYFHKVDAKSYPSPLCPLCNTQLLPHTHHIAQTRMKKQMTRYNNDQAYNDASQQTKEHRQLPQTDNSRRKLMALPRKVERSIWGLNIRCPTYSQVATGLPLRYRWCNDDYTIITEHWPHHSPAMGYWQELKTARLTEQEAFLDDSETTIAILNSQNAVAYSEIIGL